MYVAVSISILTALNSSLKAENFSGDNFIYCNFCCSLKSASVVPAFSEVGRYLVIQLKRFVSHDNQVIKDIKHVQCTPNISVPVKDNEVTYQKDYYLITSINYTGNLNRGHYTSFIKIPNSTSLLHCNDPAVLRANENKVSNTSSYITSTNHIKFFFLIALCKGAWISFLVFRCDDPTYNSSLLAFCFVRGLGYFSLSLGVTNLHITPVRLPCMVKILMHW